MTTLPINLHRDNFENIETAWGGDLWDRKRLGLQLERYVDRLQCGAVLALDAGWGEGKTWFVRHWAKHLTDTEHDVIYLDAFANDYLDDPFLVIASEIAAKLDKTADKKLVHKFKKAAAVMQQGLLTIAPTLIASMISCAITGGIIPFIKIDSESIQDKINDAVDNVSENIGEKVTEAIQNKINSYEEEKQSLLAFKNTLTELAASLEKPLVFIIDELDRCRPDFAIRLIERIKHFFDIPKIVFVLVMNKKQLINGIEHIYGYDNESSKIYLEKFIDFEIPLPQISYPNDYHYLHHEKIAKLLNLVGVYTDDICFIFYMAQHDQYKTPRELKRLINQFALLKQDRKSDIFLVLALMQGSNNIQEKMINIFFTFLNGYVPLNDSINLKRLNSQDFVKFQSKLKSKFNYESSELLRLIKKLKQAESENDVLLAYNLYAVDDIGEDFSSQFKAYIEHNLY